MKTFLKWTLAPIAWLAIALVVAGFMLYILVEYGPAEAWRELKLGFAAVAADLKSFFWKA